MAAMTMRVNLWDLNTRQDHRLTPCAASQSVGPGQLES